MQNSHSAGLLLCGWLAHRSCLQCKLQVSLSLLSAVLVIVKPMAAGLVFWPALLLVGAGDTVVCFHGVSSITRRRMQGLALCLLCGCLSCSVV